MNRTILLIWLLTLTVLFVQGVTAYTQLPDRVVSHMTLHGQADGESSKESFILTFVMGILATNMWVPIINIIMRKAPRSVINLPNGDYWLGDPTRRAEASGKMSDLMAAVMALINICFIIVFQDLIDLTLLGVARIPVQLAYLPVGCIVVLTPLYILKAFKLPADRIGPGARQ